MQSSCGGQLQTEFTAAVPGQWQLPEFAASLEIHGPKC